MKHKVKYQILSLISALLMVVATVVVSSASWWVLYQPRAPKSLRK